MKNKEKQQEIKKETSTPNINWFRGFDDLLVNVKQRTPPNGKRLINNKSFEGFPETPRLYFGR